MTRKKSAHVLYRGNTLFVSGFFYPQLDLQLSRAGSIFNPSLFPTDGRELMVWELLPLDTLWERNFGPQV